ncbi:ABC transporter ATP-binding protein/permease [Sabulicella rubraurantiaca]|uniref:ABC transporter ATP-binding protein/permease n=1 Tax=Sabulicella rubraurantiaca TaxID=2811429 RepID=UPI001A959B7A|nr:ABC transporter ATP-binding protein/permease [Sabulicella rubraurantiaca]
MTWRATLRDAATLVLPFWRSPEKGKAWTLLLVVVGLNLALVAMSVLLSFWNREFFNSLEARDAERFTALLFTWAETDSGTMPGFAWIAAIYIFVAVYALYLRQALQIRWRRWLTEGMLDHWLAERAHYRLSLEAGEADNPDQRVSEDAKLFVDMTLTLGLGLMRSVVTLLSFLFVLWSLSDSVTVLGVTIPGYLVWVAILYAGLGTWLAHLIGRPLARLNFRQQRVEADFRYALVRFRDGSEGIALHRGEAEERAGLMGRFAAVMQNWWDLMVATKRLTFFTAGYTQVAIVFPFVVAAPAFFAGRIPLGGLTQTASAFNEVQGALSWIVDNYAALTEWRATVTRLTGFRQALEEARARAGEGVKATATPGDTLRLDGVSIALPDGRALLRADHAEIRPGERVLVTGPSGSGKSTLFRAIAGIWPFGSGRVEVPEAARAMFLPQRPYLPLGTLRRAVCYPSAPDSCSEMVIREAMELAGLAHLLPRLDEEDAWGARLSGGEQQRLALARALLNRPDWLFLDEATASLDPTMERRLYELLLERLPGLTLVSIAHRPGVAEFHTRRWEVRDGRLYAGTDSSTDSTAAP